MMLLSVFRIGLTKNMNIFYLDKSPKLAAIYHNDKHVVKMVLETAQILCTAHRVLSPSQKFPKGFYKQTHVNHPCSIWVRESKQNYRFLVKLFFSLCKEYTYRYGKTHKSQILLEDFLMDDYGYFPKSKFTIPPRCMPDYCKVNIKNDRKLSVVESYRNYYRMEKLNFSVWTKRPIPNWIY